MKDITRENFLVEADRFGVSGPNDILDAVRAAVEKWHQFAAQAELSDSAAGTVSKDFRVI